MNVVELEALDRAVVVALGGKPHDGFHHDFADLPDPAAFPVLREHDGDWARCPFLPSTRWEHGGPIIEREGISIVLMGAANRPLDDYWAAECGDSRGVGRTPLIAAMRAFVASKK